MQTTHLYTAESGKDIRQFVNDLEESARSRGFIFLNKEKMDMAKGFRAHNLEVDEGFDLHMIQLCKPAKACKSLHANIERSILMPKFIMAFSKNGKTRIRFLSFPPETIAALVDDPEFPASIGETYRTIIDMIEEAQ